MYEENRNFVRENRMKIKVSDYIADFLAAHGVHQVFSVVGGGAMHLNDSLGHHEALSTIYQHHEQAAAMAAECYTRLHGEMAALCVTSGPGALNAISGVVGAYQDSIPMIVLSGQAKSTLCIAGCGGKIRTIGGQEADVVSAVRNNMTKNAVMLMQPERVRYELEKAFFLAREGRPGPCWIDIPLDVQGMYVEETELEGYVTPAPEGRTDVHMAAKEVLAHLQEAERPVLYAGNGIRLSGGVEIFRRLRKVLGIPVVTCWGSIDLIATDDSLYVGRGGNMGDRAGNFAVQNSDMVLSIGASLSINQVGWDTKTWARAAYVAMVDIDPLEMEKWIVHVDLPICADAAEFMEALLHEAEGKTKSYVKWVERCEAWKARYPVVQERHRKAAGKVNLYAFLDAMSRNLPQNAVTIAANASATVAGSQAFYIKDGDRFLLNGAMGSMGYALPASIGACVANGKERVFCIEGDGSIMMNVQELQTIATNRLPIVLFVLNNEGYHQIRQTQSNVFAGHSFVGVGPASGDLGFPDFERLAAAFGLPYDCIGTNEGLADHVKKVLATDGPLLCEVIVSTDQPFEPKSATKRLADGSLFSPPLEDMAPFLSREELAENMIIPLVEERSTGKSEKK